MLRNHLSLGWRTLVRNKVFSVINIVGLSIGLTAFILIMLYVRFELSYDDFHYNAKDIYRINTSVDLSGDRINYESSTYQGIIDALRDNCPEIKSLTVISTFNSDGTLLRIADDGRQRKAISTFKGCYADAAFFKVLSFPLIAGNPRLALQRPFSAVISQSVANMYFDGNVIGKTLELTDDDSGAKRLTITGILADVPANSHLQFDVLVNIPEVAGSFWTWAGHPYMVLHPDADVTALEDKLNLLAATNANLKTNADDYGQVSTFRLQPLQEIHLFSQLDYEFEKGGYGTLVHSLAALACLLVVIGWVNYINLSTAMSTQKVRQIGVRRIIGASKRTLAFQALVESAICNAISLALAFLLAWLLQPLFNQILNVPSTAIKFYDPSVWKAAMAFMIISTLASGVYPASVIASLHPVAALKGSVADGFPLRKALVVFQFAAAIVLTITTAVVFKQLRFMKKMELGINIDQVLIIKAMNFDKETWSDQAGGYVVDSIWLDKALLFQEELRRQSDIDNAAALSHLPGQLPNWGTEFKAERIDPVKAYSLLAVGIDYNYIPTLQVNMLAGRNFSPAFPSDHGNENKRAVLINDATRKLLGFHSPEDAVSEHIRTYWGADYEIIGVVNSFHHLSAKENMSPLYFILQPRALSYFAVRLKTTDPSRSINEVNAIWVRHFPDVPFNYFFLDDFFNRQYQNEETFSKSIVILTTLSLFIACLGLFGLTSFATIQRTKEIGIRKVLGATVANVIALCSRDFVRLYLMACVFAIPLVYLGVTRWLDNYPYRISLVWWLFAFPVITIAIIAISTVGLQVNLVARRNPTEILSRE